MQFGSGEFTFGGADVPSDYAQGEDPGAAELMRGGLLEESRAGGIQW